VSIIFVKMNEIKNKYSFMIRRMIDFQGFITLVKTPGT